MQFCVAVILLYRPYAAFGTSVSELDASELARRDICVQHARILASIVGDYLKIHKSATTMASTGLYNIATAAVVLIADSADRGSLDQRSDHLYNIKVLVAALQDLEASYLVAETVLKQIGYLLKRSQLFRKTIAPCELTRTSWPANHTTPSIFSSVSL